MTTFHPLGSRVLIKPDRLPEKTAGGIVIPEVSRDQKSELKKGTLVATGPGALIESGEKSGERFPMPDGQSVLPDARGKKVYYYAANEGIVTDLKIDGELHHVLRADNIDAYVNEDGEIVPLHDRVIVRPRDSARRTDGGIWIPDSARVPTSEGNVVAIGTGKIRFGGRIQPLMVAIGDRVMYGKFAGTPLRVGGETLLVLRDEEFSCVIEEDAPTSASTESEITRTLLESEPVAGGE